MSDKTNNSKHSLSLPKGGGAVKGIGETFQPNLFSGTGNFSVPIFTSPGRNGFGPKLNLQYSTGSGNGPFGLGWQLSVPRITRKTEKGLPKYTDEDVFVMSGAEDLVKSDEHNSYDCNGYRVIRYRPRTEGLFAKIEKWNKDGDVHWRATTKENVTSIYGRTAKARICDPNPQKKDHIYEWLLEETFDAKGNHILYEYAKDDPELKINEIYEKNRNYCQLYIRRIYYGNVHIPDHQNSPPDAVALIGPERSGTSHEANNMTELIRKYLFEVVFDYGDLGDADQPEYKELSENGDQELFGLEVPRRPDTFSSFRSGFEIRSLRRCRRALMVHHFTELNNKSTIVKSTDFEYSNDPQTKISLLQSATVTGYRLENNKYEKASMPPVTFKYSEFKPQEQHYQSLSARDNNLPPFSLKDPETTLVDIHGDGIPDILNTSNGLFRYWRNLGNGNLDMPHPQHQQPAGLKLDQPGVAFGDMAGDGMADLIVQTPQIAGFYEATPDGNWKSFRKFENYPAFNLADPNVRLTDLTGDGKSDILMTRDRHFLWFECLGEEGYDRPKATLRKHDLNEFPDIYFNDPSGRIRLADMSGDGLNDIVMLHNGRIDYWPNLGYGKFGKQITMQNFPRLQYNFDPKRLFLADIDGSGCTDLVYVDTGKVHFWFNQSGSSWSNEQIIHGTPQITDVDAIQFADIFGTGTATLLWSYDYNNQPGGNYKALDFCGGTKPFVLNEMSNNMGATTKVKYTPSTKFYLEDKHNGLDWVTNLPFPVQVVEKVEVIDHISKTKLVTTYKYHHGYYDGKEKEFRGFGRVDQFDTEHFNDFSQPGLHEPEADFTNNKKGYHVPPVETQTWFHTGVYFDEDKPDTNGNLFDFHKLMESYEKEFYAKDSSAFKVDQHLFTDKQDNPCQSETPHEAFRALRGAILRTEVYAHDGSEKQIHPYLMTQNRYKVKELQEKGSNPHAVYLTTQEESLSYHYERNPEDPRIGHDITLETDKFGNITEKVSIGYPRRLNFQDFDEQKELHILNTKTKFINEDTKDDYYYIGIPCEVKLFELTGIKWSWDDNRRLKKEDFKDIPDNFQDYHWQREASHGGIKKRIVEWTRTYFRKNENPHIIDPINSLAHRLQHGEIESLALPYESYQAIFASTAKLKEQLEDSDKNHEFRINLDESELSNILRKSGGYYKREDDFIEEAHKKYWWIPSGRQGFDENLFYLPIKSQDPFGNISKIKYDDYGLLMKHTIDPLNNVIEVENNYRVLQPYTVIDPNQNRTVVRFDSLGLVVATSVMGKEINGSWEGDCVDFGGMEIQPGEENGYTTKLEYNLFRYLEHKKPAFVKTLARENHKDPNTRWQESYLYFDGFGREVQTKVQAEPGDAYKLDNDGMLILESTNDRWVGTGRKIFNNKGKPVKQYEPFFSKTHEYEDEASVVESGVTPVLFYDPLERVVCTVHPNHTYEKVIFDPWKQETWDNNDTVLLDPRLDNDVTGYVKDHFEEYDQQYRADNKGEDSLTWYDQRKNLHNSPEQEAAHKTAKHAKTPTIAHLDSLGRVFLTIVDNGIDKDRNLQLFKSHVKLDIEGNDLEITDPRNIIAFTHHFDMAGRKIFTYSVDAGHSAVIPDVAGNPLRTIDANKNVIEIEYDALRRPTHTWVTPHNKYSIDENADNNLAQFTVYGESLTEEFAKINNLRGQLFATFDGAGVVVNNIFDFKANLLKTSRRLHKSHKANEVDWKDLTDTDFTKPLHELESIFEIHLSKEAFITTSSYDALNRVIDSTNPDHSQYEAGSGASEPIDGSKYIYQYNEANLLEKVTVNLKKEDGSRTDMVFVSNINYNAKGQRSEIEYGNGAITKYTYDPSTFRLIKLDTFRRNDETDKLQLLKYTYDPVGNILQINNQAIESIWRDQSEIEPVSKYEYDPLYRLIYAEGREHQGMLQANNWQNSDGIKNSMFLMVPPHPNDSQALQRYKECYEYDESGNITGIKHKRMSGLQRGKTIWTRTQKYYDNSNRIKTRSTTSSLPNNKVFGHDFNGNLLSLQPDFPDDNPREESKQRMKWDYRNQLVEVQLNEGSAPNRAFYQYDSTGQRVRKYIYKNNGSCIEERIYLGGVEIFRKRNNVNAEPVFERQTLRVMDDQTRIALVETLVKGQDSTDNTWQRIRYQLNDHLGSSILELDEQANTITYEEYYPYGGTSYIAGQSETEVKRKHYRYSGKERDDETGLYYYGARYYAPWMGRWCSCDPLKVKQKTNIFEKTDTYTFVKNRSIINIDPKGFEEKNFFVYMKNENGKPDRYLDYGEPAANEIAQKKGFIPIGVSNLEEMITELNDNLKEGDTIGTIFIMTHGGYNSKTKESHFLMPSEEVDDGLQNKESLQDAAVRLREPLWDLHEHTTDETLIDFRACSLGQDPEMLVSIGKFFGGKGITVKAPKIRIHGHKGSTFFLKDPKTGKHIPYESNEARQYIETKKAFTPMNTTPDFESGRIRIKPKTDYEVPLIELMEP